MTLPEKPGAVAVMVHSRDVPTLRFTAESGSPMCVLTMERSSKLRRPQSVMMGGLAT